MSDKIEFWDIYDSDKKPTGRTMKRNDWHLKDGEYHLTVLGVMQRTDGRFLITKRYLKLPNFDQEVRCIVRCYN